MGNTTSRQSEEHRELGEEFRELLASTERNELAKKLISAMKS
jgi:hypothetical protein